MKKDDKYLPIGAKVQVNATFVKQKIYKNSGDDDEYEYENRHTETKWHSVPCEVKQAAIVGLRRVQDGEMVYGEPQYWDEEYHDNFDKFTVTKSHIVYLVSFNPWHEPVKVHPDDLSVKCES